MIAKSKRLNKAIFDEVFKKGIFFNSTNFTAKILAIPSENTRVAVSVSKKQASKAVERNKIRRKMYDVLKEKIPPKGFLMIFLPKKSVIDKEKADLDLEIQKIISKVERKD